MGKGDFKSDLLKYGYINYDSQTFDFPGNIYATNISAGNLYGNITGTIPNNANLDVFGNVVGNSVVAGQVNSTTITSTSFVGNGAFLTGVVQTIQGRANIDIVGNVTAPGNITISGKANVTGTMSASYFLGNGSQLTGVVTSFPSRLNIDIVGNVTAPGNVVVSGQVTSAGNVIAQYLFGNGSQLVGVLKTIPSTANVDIAGNVTAPGNVIVSGQVIAIGNVAAQYFIGNGSQLVGVLKTLPSQASTDIIGNVTAPGNVFVNGQVFVVGNVTANVFFGNGSQLTGVFTVVPSSANIDIVGNVTSPGNVVVNGQVTSAGNVVAQYFIGNSSLLQGVLSSTLSRANVDIVGNVTTPGNVFVNGQVTASGNVVARNLIGNGSQLTGVLKVLPSQGNIDIIGNVSAPGNVFVNGQIAVVGNVTANVFIGNGSQLTGIITAFPSIANIDIVGNVNAPGNVNVTGQVMILGNITAQYFSGNGSQLTSVLKMVPSRANIDIVGNVNAPGNVVVNGQVTTIGNVTARYLIGNGSLLSGVSSVLPTRANIDITGNVTASGNVVVNGQVTAIGNVVASYFIGNGSQLVGVLKTLPSRANVDIVGNVSAPGNVFANGQLVIAGNVTANVFLGNGSLLTGIVTAFPSVANIDIVGNVVAPGNVSVNGQVRVIGNVVANYFFGNGSLLSGVVASLPSVGCIDIIGNVFAPGDVLVNGDANISGNVTAPFFYGNGVFLTNVVTVLPQVIAADIIGNVVAPGGGQLVVSGQVNTLGNVVGGVFSGNGALLQNVPTPLPRVANIDVVGNVTSAGNISVSGQVNVVGNVTSTFFVGNGSQLTGISQKIGPLIATDILGNVTSSGNVFVQGQVSTLGNVVASFFVGNGSQLANVLNAIPATGNIDVFGNVSGSLANVTTLIAIRGNIGNVVTSTGTVTANTFFGNGSRLTGILTSVATSANADVQGNVGANVLTTYSLTVNGNASMNYVKVVGNVFSGPPFIITTPNYLIGNGYGITYPGIFLIPSGNVANQTVRLNSNLSPGAYVTQNDNGLQYLLTTSPANVSTNWIQIKIDTLNVTSVFGRTGAVFANVNDYSDAKITLTNSVGPVPSGANVSNAIVYLDTTKATIVNGVVSASAFLGNVSSPGNVDVSNVATSVLTFQTSANVTGQVNVVGNVIQNYVFGNGLLLSGVSFPLPSLALIDIVGNVFSPSNVSVAGQITVVGNVIAPDMRPTTGNLYLFSSNVQANIVSIVSNGVPSVLNGQVNVTGNMTSTGTLLGNLVNAGGNVFANVFTGNVLARGNVDVNGNIVTNTLRVYGNVFVSGNTTANGMSLSGNLVAVGNVSISGNFSTIGIPIATSGDIGNYAPLYIDTSSNVVTTRPSLLTIFANVRSQVANAGLMYTYNGSLFASGRGWNNTSGNFVYGYLPVNIVPSPIMFPGATPQIVVKTVVHDCYNAAVLTTDGRVYWWGTTAAGFVPTQLSFGGASISKIAYGRQRMDDGTSPSTYGTFGAISTTGQLYMWGENGVGQCGLGNYTTPITTPQTVLSGLNVRDVFISQSDRGSVAAVLSNGQMYVWGVNLIGELGLGNTSTTGFGGIASPILRSSGLMAANANVVDVKYSGYVSGTTSTQSCRVLLANGTTFATGYTQNGESGIIVSTIPRVQFQREVTNLSNVAAIGTLGVGCPAHYAILNNGNILFCGNTATFGVNISPYTQATFTQFLGTSTNGNIALQGFQGAMLANVGSGPAVTTPKVITASSGIVVSDRYSVLILDRTGNLYGCRFNRTGNFGNGITYSSITTGDVTNGFQLLNQFLPGPNTQIVDVTTGGNPNATGNEYGTIVSVADGSVYAAGTNRYGSVPNCYNPYSADPPTSTPQERAVPYFVPIVGRNLFNY